MVDNGGCTFNGVPASTYGLSLKYAPDLPMLPGTKDRTASVLGRAGDIWIGSEQEPRTFSLECQFLGCASKEALDVLIRAFAAVLVDIDGKPQQISLIFDEAPNYTYLVRYNSRIPFSREWVGASPFTLELIADDPYAYEAEETTLATVTTSPATIPVISSSVVKTPAKICIENTGASPVNGFTLKIYY